MKIYIGIAIGMIVMLLLIALTNLFLPTTPPPCSYYATKPITEVPLRCLNQSILLNE